MKFLSQAAALVMLIAIFPLFVIVELGYLFVKDSPSDDTREF